MLPGREESARKRIDANTTARANLDFRLVRREEALNKQFNKLDALVSNLNNTSSYLTTQLKRFENNKTV